MFQVDLRVPSRWKAADDTALATLSLVPPSCWVVVGVDEFPSTLGALVTLGVDLDARLFLCERALRTWPPGLEGN